MLKRPHRFFRRPSGRRPHVRPRHCGGLSPRRASPHRSRWHRRPSGSRGSSSFRRSCCCSSLAFWSGPVLGWLQPRELFGDVLNPLVSLAVAVILYEGGLSLKMKERGAYGTPILRLLTVGVVVTWCLATIAGLVIANLPWETAMVLGAILTVTGPTVIGPLLRQIRPRGPGGADRQVGKAIVVDVVGATLAVLVLHVATEGYADGGAMHSATGAVIDLFKTALVGTVCGIMGTYALAIPLRNHLIPDELENAVSARDRARNFRSRRQPRP